MKQIIVITEISADDFEKIIRKCVKEEMSSFLNIKADIEDFDLAVEPLSEQKMCDQSISTRMMNCLAQYNILSLKDIVVFMNLDDNNPFNGINRFLYFRRFGEKSLRELKDLLDKKNIPYH